ncbi:hypothetical protein D3Z58_08405 [Clostridiaceae bacterium]|nr:hypothetical protein [Clostridiaceae bacterium]
MGCSSFFRNGSILPCCEENGKSVCENIGKKVVRLPRRTNSCNLLRRKWDVLPACCEGFDGMRVLIEIF